MPMYIQHVLVALTGIFVSKNKGDLRPFGAAREVAEGRLKVFHDAPAMIIILKDVKGVDSPDFDCGICGQNMCLAAHALGLATCFIGFTKFIEKNETLMTRLGIAYPWQIATGIVLGYPKLKTDGLVQRDRPQIDWYSENNDQPEIIY